MRCLLPLLAAAAAAQLAGAQLERIRDIALPEYAADLLPSATGRIAALSFSPDEQWLAIAVNDPGPQPAGARLLVVSRERQAAVLRASVRIPPLGGRAGSFPRLAWSPSGGAVAAESEPAALVTLADQRVCVLDEAASALVGGFVDSTTWVAAGRAAAAWSLLTADLDCSPRRARGLDGAPVSIDLSPDRTHIAVALVGDRVILYAASSGEVAGSWGRPARPALAFTGNDVLCDAGLPAREQSRPECWSVRDGTTLPPLDVEGGAPISAARSAPLLALTDGRFRWDGFFEVGERGVRRAVLIDVPSGKRVLGWSPATRPCLVARSILQDCREPAPLALSPSGMYLAEVRGASVRVYRVKR